MRVIADYIGIAGAILAVGVACWRDVRGDNHVYPWAIGGVLWFCLCFGLTYLIPV